MTPRKTIITSYSKTGRNFNVGSLKGQDFEKKKFGCEGSPDPL